MRKKGSICDYIDERNRDLDSAYKDIVSRSEISNVMEIFSKMSMMPARRFYISEPRAYELIHHHRRDGKWPVGMSGMKLKLMNEIKRLTDAFMQAEADLALVDAVYRAVNSPAPSFYLTPGTIKTLFYRRKQEARAARSDARLTK